MLSQKKGNLSEKEVEEIKQIFGEFHLWKPLDEIGPQDIIKASKSDKKMEGNQIKFILLRKIGEAYIDRSVTDEEMLDVLRKWD